MYDIQSNLLSEWGVTASKDTLLVAQYFFTLLQFTVVSGIDWTQFLAKGESATLSPNKPKIVSIFGQQLGNFGGKLDILLPGISSVWSMNVVFRWKIM